MSEKSCWYSLKNVGKCSNGGIKYKPSALLHISYLSEMKYYVSTSKPLMMIFNWYQRCWCILNSSDKNVKQSLFSRAGIKVLKFYDQPKKVCNMFKKLIIFYSKCICFKSTKVLKHVWIKTKHLLHTKISWEKSILTIYWKKYYKIGKINTNLKLSCAFVNNRAQHILHPCESMSVYFDW